MIYQKKEMVGRSFGRQKKRQPDREGGGNLPGCLKGNYPLIKSLVGFPFLPDITNKINAGFKGCLTWLPA